jgi:sugar/nucleoside kinase (ribokinase family)
MELTPGEMLDYLKSRGCRIGGVTMGERGLIWYDETGTARSVPALAVPPAVIVDTSGAGDVFHGAYLYAYLADPTGTWENHFKFARAASAHKIQHLGNEAGLPSLDDIDSIRRRFGDPAEPRAGLHDPLRPAAEGQRRRGKA